MTLNIGVYGPHPLARILAEHDEPIAVRRVAARERSLRPHRHLPRTRRSPKLLNAVGVEDSAIATRPIVSTTGEERMRTLDPDVISVEVVGLTPLDSVPLECLQELLGER